MESKGIHYLAQAKIKQRLENNTQEFARVTEQLQEAVRMGDLRENSEYDAALEARAKVRREREMLLPVLTMPVLRASDNIAIFEEGCVVELRVYGTVDRPLDGNSVEFSKIVEQQSPQFEGKVMLGGTLPIQDLLADAALSIETPIGAYLLGKQSGRYSIKVPGGFAIVTASKLRSTEFTPEQIGCVYHEP